ncbi:hypothetical protein ACFPU1_12040 [Thalassorhabdus alkalitolerans]|uniref:Uncharacterized protein n=1 Tax=Thalassorhabdus alkalitolerans TaxID=2282697 RepID=A0ABW0YQ02_9BACI
MGKAEFAVVVHFPETKQVTRLFQETKQIAKKNPGYALYWIFLCL